MRRVVKFFRLSNRERIRLVGIATLVVLIRLGLWVLPFRTVYAVTTRLSRPGRARAEQDHKVMARLMRELRTASRFVPQATCLTQALVALILLGRKSLPAELCIGVAKNDSGKLEAHAWVKSGGRVVIGRTADLPRFTELSAQGEFL